MHLGVGLSLFQIIVYCLFGTNPLAVLVMTICQFDSEEQSSVSFKSKYKKFQVNTLENVGLFVEAPLCTLSSVNSLRPSDAYMRQLTHHHWFRYWLVAWPAPSHYLNQCWIIVNWTLRNKLLWNLNRNSNVFIQENAFESVVCETASILSRPQCVNPSDAEAGIFKKK